MTEAHGVRGSTPCIPILYYNNYFKLVYSKIIMGNFKYICTSEQVEELKERISRLEQELIIRLDGNGVVTVRDLVNPDPREIRTFTEIMPEADNIIAAVTKNWRDYKNISSGQIFHIEPSRVYFMLGNPLEKFDEFVIYLSHQENNLRHERS